MSSQPVKVLGSDLYAPPRPVASSRPAVKVDPARDPALNQPKRLEVPFTSKVYPSWVYWEASKRPDELKQFNLGSPPKPYSQLSVLELSVDPFGPVTINWQWEDSRVQAYLNTSLFKSYDPSQSPERAAEFIDHIDHMGSVLPSTQAFLKYFHQLACPWLARSIVILLQQPTMLAAPLPIKARWFVACIVDYLTSLGTSARARKEDASVPSIFSAQPAVTPAPVAPIFQTLSNLPPNLFVPPPNIFAPPAPTVRVAQPAQPAAKAQPAHAAKAASVAFGVPRWSLIYRRFKTLTPSIELHSVFCVNSNANFITRQRVNELISAEIISAQDVFRYESARKTSTLFAAGPTVNEYIMLSVSAPAGRSTMLAFTILELGSECLLIGGAGMRELEYSVNKFSDSRVQLVPSYSQSATLDDIQTYILE
jgi:hypothetical protein